MTFLPIHHFSLLVGLFSFSGRKVCDVYAWIPQQQKVSSHWYCWRKSRGINCHRPSFSSPSSFSSSSLFIHATNNDDENVNDDFDFFDDEKFDDDDDDSETFLEIQNSFDLQKKLQSLDNTLYQQMMTNNNNNNNNNNSKNSNSKNTDEKNKNMKLMSMSSDLISQLQEIAAAVEKEEEKEKEESNSSNTYKEKQEKQEEEEEDDDDHGNVVLETDGTYDFDDENLIIGNPVDIQKALSSSSSSSSSSQLSPSPSSLSQEVMEQLQEIAAKSDYNEEEEEEDKENNDTTTTSTNNSIIDFEKYNLDDNEYDDDDDSVFLDADAYVQASNNLRPDGSLPDFIFQRQSMSTAATNPSNGGGGGGVDDEPTIQDLIDLVNRKKQEAFDDDSGGNLEKAKAMRDKIFADEGAFLSQSKEFLDGLGGNVQAAEEAKFNRRNAQYRKEQSREENKLDMALDEWQKELLSKQQQQNKRGNSNQEKDAKGKKSPSPSNRAATTAAATTLPQGEWVAVDDPSTGEQFYWNSETGEMKWDLLDGDQDNYEED